MEQYSYDNKTDELRLRYDRITIVIPGAHYFVNHLMHLLVAAGVPTDEHGHLSDSMPTRAE